MNKQAIGKTAVSYWSKKYKEFIVESPLLDGCSGIGSTEEEARRVFHDLLSDAYEAYLEGRMPGYSKPGRPSKSGVPLNTNVQPVTKDIIKDLAEEIGCSHGEVVDYLAFFFKVRGQQPVYFPERPGGERVGEVAERKSTYRAKNPVTLEELVLRVEALEGTRMITRRRKK